MQAILDNTKTQSSETQAKISPFQAIDWLKKGNERFIANSKLNRHLREQVNQTAHGQFPFATVLGCIDSRVPAEVVFDQGIGDIFNVRIAGNFVNTDILGSLEFACKVAGSKTIVVMGHSQCGAIKGACDGVELGNLTEMLSKLKPAINSIDDVSEDRSSKNAKFVQQVADANVKITIDTIRTQSPILSEMEKNGEISIVGAMYHVETGKVEFLS